MEMDYRTVTVQEDDEPDRKYVMVPQVAFYVGVFGLALLGLLLVVVTVLL